MKDRSLSDKINLTLIALTVTAIHHCLSPWTTGEFRVLPEFGPGGGAQCKCNTRNMHHAVNNACKDEFRHFDADFRSCSPEVNGWKIDNIRSMIIRRIHSTGMDPGIAQPHNDQGSFEKEFFHYIPEELIEQPDKSSTRLSSIGAATEASMRSSAVLHMGGPAIASSSQHVPCSNSNSIRNNITSITNMTSVENTGWVDGITIVEGAMSLGGYEWCQWPDLGFPLCTISFLVSSIYHNSSKCKRTDDSLKADLKCIIS